MKVFIDDIRNPVNHLTPEQSEGIVWLKEWWEAKRFLITNSKEIEVIHFDNYMDEPDLTGKDLFFMVAGDCMWGDKTSWTNLKQIYLHSSDEDLVDELMVECFEELKASGVELIKNCLDNRE